jgi:predicted permease
MALIKGLLKQLRAVVRKDDVERELSDEMAFHVDMETEKLMRGGLDAASARRQALLKFGGIERHKEGVRAARWTHVLDELSQDLRYAWRGLLRSPGFAVVAVITLALGVGATTAIFSVTNAVLFRPPPMPNPDRVAALRELRSGGVSQQMGFDMLPEARIEQYRAATTQIFSSMATMRWESVSLRSGEDARTVPAELVSASYFEVLGIRPALGRWFLRDDEPGVVLSERLWRAQFRSDPSVVGKTVFVDSRQYMVLGVAPASYRGMMIGFVTDAWIPLRTTLTTGSNPWLLALGRIRTGITRAEAAAQLNVIAQQLPVETGTQVRGAELSAFDGLPSQGRAPAMGFMGMLLATALLVLLIGSMNIAGVLLARGLARRREVGVRLTLGAGRPRLVRQLLTETTLLFLIGGAFGLLVAFAVTRALENIQVPGSPQLLFDFTPDLRVLAFGLGLACLTGLVFGLAPALQSSAPDLTLALKDGTPGSGQGRTRLRSLFVAAQVGMAVLLLVVAGLFMRTFQRATATDLALDARDVVVATVTLRPHGYDAQRGRAFYAQLLEHVRALPGVEDIGLARTVPLTGSHSGENFGIVGQSADEEKNAGWNVVDPGFFSTLRVPFLKGAPFSSATGPNARREVVVNQYLAARFWPNKDPIGQRLTQGRDTFVVVGVTRDGKYTLVSEDPEPFLFLPVAHNAPLDLSLFVRTRADAAATLAGIRNIVRALDPNVALDKAMPYPYAISFSLFGYRFGALLIGILGGLGLVLAGVGVYGVLAAHVAQRTREFGIRIALGAEPSAVLALVLGPGALVVAGGALAGLGLAAILTRFLQSFLFGVSPLDRATFLGVPLLLSVVALLASYFPARRATRVDPIKVLRAD